MAETIDQLYEEMVNCTSCKMRKSCTQVVTAAGQRKNPALMIIGEAPGQQEDEAGEPFVGAAGQSLRAVLRSTGILTRENTLITNVLKCRPPKNKFPTGDAADICVAKWLWEEIRLAAPKRILLLGSVPLEYVAGLEGITACRGQWYTIRGIRTLATFHPQFIFRKDNEGITHFRENWIKDIKEIAAEVEEELKKEEGKSTEPEQGNNTEEVTDLN